MLRLLIFVGVVLVIFLPFNWVAIRHLRRIHPRRKKAILVAAILGNLIWPFFPAMRYFNDFSRAVRAVLGPLWWGWTMFAVVYTLFVLVMLLVWLPFRRRRPFAEFAHTPSRVYILLLIVGFIAGYIQAIVPLRVERVTIRVPNLTEPARIALMGDLHVGLFTRPSRLTKIFGTATSLQPDAVLIAGDLIDDDPHFVPKLLAGTQALAPQIPIYAVFGNHEMYGNPGKVYDGLAGSRIRLLVNEGVALKGAWIAGVSDRDASQTNDPAQRARFRPDLPKALAGRPPASVPVVLVHNPLFLEEVRKAGVPVALCAHTHGGQFGYRPWGLSLAGVFLRHHMGHYDVPPTQLYINTGTGYWWFPFRLGMTPEITLIELQPR